MKYFSNKTVDTSVSRSSRSLLEFINFKELGKCFVRFSELSLGAPRQKTKIRAQFPDIADFEFQMKFYDTEVGYKGSTSCVMKEIT